MTTPRLALADELAEIRAEIARLKRRELALASIEHHFPQVSVFRPTLRPGWPMQRASDCTPPRDQTRITHAHA